MMADSIGCLRDCLCMVVAGCTCSCSSEAQPEVGTRVGDHSQALPGPSLALHTHYTLAWQSDQPQSQQGPQEQEQQHFVSAEQ